MVGVGLSLASTFVPSDPEAAVGRMVERTRAGAAAGLDFLTVGDHHNNRHLYMQNVPMLGRLAADWPTDPNRPIGCLFLLPLWNPLLVAEQVATLSAMHPGRFVLQTGIGWGEASFAAMNASHSTRGADLEEAVRVIRALFDGRSVSSERFGTVDAVLGVPPPRPVEWWMGAGVDKALDRTARLGASLYVSPGTIEQMADTIDRFRARCEAHGHKPERIVVRQDTLVADDEPTARRLVSQVFERGYRGMTPEVVSTGTVDQITERFAAIEACGATDLAVRQMAVSDDQAVRSIELLGDVRANLG